MTVQQVIEMVHQPKQTLPKPNPAPLQNPKQVKHPTPQDTTQPNPKYASASVGGRIYDLPRSV